MSWGERSCGQGRPCGYNPTLDSCNVDCPGYRWDGITKLDSGLEKAFELGWIAGSVMNYQNPGNRAKHRGYDFEEGLRRLKNSQEPQP